MNLLKVIKIAIFEQNNGKKVVDQKWSFPVVKGLINSKSIGDKITHSRFSSQPWGWQD